MDDVAVLRLVAAAEVIFDLPDADEEGADVNRLEAIWNCRQEAFRNLRREAAAVRAAFAERTPE